jgi:hypothetical protein
MQPSSTIEPPGSPVPGVVPEPVHVHHDAEATPTTARDPTAARDQRNPAAMVLAKLLSGLRGDKYMVDAYPPDGPRGAATSATHAKER